MSSALVKPARDQSVPAQTSGTTMATTRKSTLKKPPSSKRAKIMKTGQHEGDTTDQGESEIHTHTSSKVRLTCPLFYYHMFILLLTGSWGGLDLPWIAKYQPKTAVTITYWHPLAFWYFYYGNSINDVQNPVANSLCHWSDYN